MDDKDGMDGMDGVDGAGKQKRASFFGRYVYKQRTPYRHSYSVLIM